MLAFQGFRLTLDSIFRGRCVGQAVDLAFVDDVGRARHQHDVPAQRHGACCYRRFLEKPVCVGRRQLIAREEPAQQPVGRIGVSQRRTSVDFRFRFPDAGDRLLSNGLVHGEQLVLQDRGIDHVLRLPPESVHVVVVEAENSAGRDQAASLEPCPVAAGYAAAVGPVGSEEVIVVQEADLTEQVAILRWLLGQVLQPDLRPLPGEVDLLRPHPNVTSVATEDIRQGHRHVVASRLLQIGQMHLLA